MAEPIEGSDWRGLATGRNDAVLSVLPCGPAGFPWPTYTHSASITTLRDGRMGAVWNGGVFEGDISVRVWFSRYDGVAWETPRDVSGEGYCCNPAIFQPARLGSPLLLYYTQREQRIKRVRSSSDNGQTWSSAATLPARSDLPTGHFMGPETNAPLELPDGSLLLGSSCRREWTPQRQCLWWVERTVNYVDDMELWSPVMPGGHQPAFLVHSPDLTELQMIGRWGGTFWSHDMGRTWTPGDKKQTPDSAFRGDALTLGNGWHVNVATYPQRSTVRVSISRDGRHWREVLTGPCGGQGYPTIARSPDGLLHMLYSDSPIRHVVLDPNVLLAP